MTLHVSLCARPSAKRAFACFFAAVKMKSERSQFKDTLNLLAAARQPISNPLSDAAATVFFFSCYLAVQSLKHAFSRHFAASWISDTTHANVSL